MFRIDDPDDNRRPDVEIRGLPTKLLGNATIAQSEVRRRTTARAVIRKNNKYHGTVKAAEYNFVTMAFELWFSVKEIHVEIEQHNSVKPAILKCVEYHLPCCSHHFFGCAFRSQ